MSQPRTPFRKNHGKITLVLYTKPFPCYGKCLYCFSTKGYTKSTSENQDTLLARDSGWDSEVQLSKRFKQYDLKHGLGNKYDIAIKGDSFTTHSKNYLISFFKKIYDFFNYTTSTSFEESTRLHENAPDRCVTIKVETRPDYIDHEWCRFMMLLGVTTVEIGVQSLCDKVLAMNNRRHDVSAVINATSLLKKYGFEVCYHMMTGLYGSCMEKDIEILSEKLWEPQFCPDAIKIYPCILLKGNRSQSKLAHLSRTNQWQPLTDKSYIDLLYRCLPKVPGFVHINRIQRLIPPQKTAKGPSEIIDRSQFKGICNCLWQRSIAQNVENLNDNFNACTIATYKQGDSFIIKAAIENNVIVGYGRLGWYNNKKMIIRDVRVLGNMLSINEPNPNRLGTQHKGIGKAIIKEMEKISLANGARSIIIHPSYGTKQYFKARHFAESKNGYMEYNCQTPEKTGNSIVWSGK